MAYVRSIWVLLLMVAVGCSLDPPEPAPTDPSIQFSYLADKSNSQLLQGAILRNADVYIYIVGAEEEQISEIEFYLNNTSHRVERLAPYDFNGSVTPWNPGALAGTQLITADIRFNNGSSLRLNASFELKGAEVLPDPPITMFDLIVSLSGSDDTGCGAGNNPCRSLKYTVEQRALSGQVIALENGVYDESGPIQVPPGVSITSVNQSAASVTLRPNFSMNSTQFFVSFDSDQQNSDGNQFISHLTWNAYAQNHTGWRAISVTNRNNVSITHNRFINWDRVNTAGDARVLEVKSTALPPVEILKNYERWQKIIPDDMGPAGDYADWVNYPQNPVRNFRFEHNFVFHSGNKTLQTERPGKAISPYHLKDSSFSHNEFDLRGVYAQAIYGDGAIVYFDNVQVSHNIFRATNTFLEGFDVGAQGSAGNSNSMYVLETWVHINGSRWHDNISNAAFSIPYNKDVHVHDNIFIRNDYLTSIKGIGIETAVSCHSTINNNYFFGGEAGIHSNVGEGNGPGTKSCKEFKVFNNVAINLRNWGFTFTSGSNCSSTNYDRLFDGYYLYNNIVDNRFDGVDDKYYGGLKLSTKCAHNPAFKNLFVRNNIYLNGRFNNAVWFELNDTRVAPVELGIENNLYYNNGSVTQSGFECRCSGGDCSHICDLITNAGNISASPDFQTEDVIIVNNGGAGTSQQGNWVAVGANELRAYQNDSVMHAGGVGDWYQFEVTGLQSAHETLVALWWPRNATANRSESVSIQIFDGIQTQALKSYTVNQKVWDSSGWYYIDRLIFSSGHARVRILSQNGAQVVADAALFSKLGHGYKLMPNSPAVDNGTNAVTSVRSRDYFGNTLPQGSAADIGIHEAQ